jgi:hypothetical protein
MYPRHDGALSYLDFPQNNLGLYDYCQANDIIDVKMKLFHYNGTYPICDQNLGLVNEFNLTQPHNGTNPFTVKRSTEPYRDYCNSYDHNSFYNIDNPPQTASDLINVPSSTTPYDDYTIDVTQMVKNSVTSNSTDLGFLIQQVQNFTFNNVLFQGGVFKQPHPNPGEPYIELTYVRRTLPIPCILTKQPTRSAIDQSRNKPALIVINPTSKNNLNPVSEKASFKPNPANSQAVISSPSKIIRIEVYDSFGNLVKQVQIDSKKTITLNTSDLRPGLYISKVITERGIETLKFIIQR